MDQIEYNVSLIIPTLNAGKEIDQLVHKILEQSVLVNEIIVIDSSSDDDTRDICSHLPIQFYSIDRKSFDHGKTRDLALRKSIGDIVVFMTQDAVPENDMLISELLSPFSDSKVAVVMARQIAKSDASITEKYIREFNYPENTQIRSKEDIPLYGIKTFFSSDVCSAYRRTIYEELGGFEYPIKTNEDMFFAAKAVSAGYKVVYNASARVLHSHNYTLKEQFKRNYLQGYEIEKHRYMLGGVSQNDEGMKLVKTVSIKLLSKGRVLSFIRFGFDCCARLIGNKAGKKAFLRG